MAYIRHDENNNQVSPQPGKTSVTNLGGSTGWSAITFDNFDTDYTRHDESNNPVGVVSTYQRHDENNNPVGVVSAYQRHDESNNPVT